MLGYRDVIQAHPHAALSRMPWRCGIDLKVLWKQTPVTVEVLIFKYNNLTSGNISIILFSPQVLSSCSLSYTSEL